MAMTPEFAYLANMIFFSLVPFTMGYFLSGLLFPLSNRPVLVPPGDAFPTGLSLALIYAMAFGLMIHYIPIPEQYRTEPKMLIEFPLFLLLGAAGIWLGRWKPMA